MSGTPGPVTISLMILMSGLGFNRFYFVEVPLEQQAEQKIDTAAPELTAKANAGIENLQSDVFKNTRGNGTTSVYFKEAISQEMHAGAEIVDDNIVPHEQQAEQKMDAAAPELAAKVNAGVENLQSQVFKNTRGNGSTSVYLKEAISQEIHAGAEIVDDNIVPHEQQAEHTMDSAAPGLKTRLGAGIESVGSNILKFEDKVAKAKTSGHGTMLDKNGDGVLSNEELPRHTGDDEGDSTFNLPAWMYTKDGLLLVGATQFIVLVLIIVSWCSNGKKTDPESQKALAGVEHTTLQETTPTGSTSGANVVKPETAKKARKGQQRQQRA